MWKRLLEWHREWEREILAILEEPALAVATPAGYRGCVARKLAALSSIERAQLRRFSLAYRGWRSYAAIGKLVLLFCLAGAALHLAMPGKFGLPGALLLANALGLSLAFGLVGIWFNYRRMHGKVVRYFFVILLLALAGAFVGALAGASVKALGNGVEVLAILERTGRSVALAGLGIGGIYALLVGVVATWRNREFEALTTQFRLEAERERLARQVSESRLRMLRAQIEPHFLFNTLGAVQQLAEAGAPRAAELTANLIAFLRGSLAEMRHEQVTLSEDFALIEAYLRVMQARLGERLQFALDLPGALAGERVPGMMLLTLVENAIKHGIEPSLRGGRIVVSAQEADGGLRLRVEDTGHGLSAGTQGGIGLDNVRDRLHLAYGEAASFALREREAGGAVAEIRVPR
ncbi:MAG: histidine kinase [Betaproteobacteria bacterium]|nr:histidine kinase [Betaproteobacteria bacterium]